MLGDTRLKLALLLGCGLLLSYAYFYQAGGWNQNSRFDLDRALVEDGTLRIDDFASNTGDKALVAGHVYSDKAPGQAFTALPVIALGEFIVGQSGGNPTAPTPLALFAYAATVVSSGVPTVLAALSVLWSARKLGASLTGATLAALAFAVASPAWAYATLLWGHALAAGCLALAFAAAIALRDPGRRTRDVLLSIVVGATAGWAVLTEYPAAPAAMIVAAFALTQAGRDRAPRVGITLACALAVAAAVLAMYNERAFGSPTQLSYAGVQGFPGMAEGVFGVTLPKRTILQELLFGTFRGLVPLAPVSLFAPIGLVLLLRRTATRAAALAAIAIPVYYLLFNSGYYYWSGGFSYGPRHIGAALPFVFLGLGELWTAGTRLVRVCIAALVAWGAALAFMAVSTIVMLPEDISSPITQVVIPAFLSGDVASNRQSFLQYGTANPAQGLLGAWNVGQVLGLPALMSLLPLVVVWLVLLPFLLQATRDRAIVARSPSRQRFTVAI